MQTEVEFDRETIQGLRNGDRQAMNVVYNAYSQQLFFFAKRYVEQEDEAEDIAIEAFAKLWTKRQLFTDTGAIRGYLLTCVRNKCLDVLRHNKMKSIRQQKLVNVLESQPQPDLLSEIIRIEVLETIYAEVDKLPEKVKQIFLLAYRDGLKTGEIAQQLNISAQTVSNQKVTAMNLIKKAFNNNHYILAVLCLLEEQWLHLH